MKKRTIGLWVGVALMLFMVACGSSGNSLTVEDPSAATVTLDIQMNDNYFGESADDIPVWTVSADDIVAVSLANQGGLNHNWAIVESGAEVPVPFREATDSDILLFTSTQLSNGQTNTEAFTAPAAGSYQIICTVAGHYPTMQAVLVVE